MSNSQNSTFQLSTILIEKQKREGRENLEPGEQRCHRQRRKRKKNRSERQGVKDRSKSY